MEIKTPILRAKNKIIILILFFVLAIYVVAIYVYADRVVYIIPDKYEGVLLIIDKGSNEGFHLKNRIYDFRKRNVLFSDVPEGFFPVGYWMYYYQSDSGNRFPVSKINDDPSQLNLAQNKMYLFEYYEKTGSCNGIKYHSVICCKPERIYYYLSKETQLIDSLICKKRK
jgi:hypothetical protein